MNKKTIIGYMYLFAVSAVIGGLLGHGLTLGVGA